MRLYAGEGNALEMLTIFDISRVVLQIGGKSGKFADEKSKWSSVTVTASRKAFADILRSNLLEKFCIEAKCKDPNITNLFSVLLGKP